MKLTEAQFEEAAFIFERENGVNHSDYEKKVIAESKLTELKATELEKTIVEGLNIGFYKKDSERISAYWSLYKIGNPKLKPHFWKWLEFELKNKRTNTIFQLLVALDGIGEKAFHPKRTSRSVDEVELNIQDARKYLEKTAHNNGYNSAG